MGLDDLDGDQTLQQRILGKIDGRHAALAELIKDPVASVFHDFSGKEKRPAHECALVRGLTTPSPWDGYTDVADVRTGKAYRFEKVENVCSHP